MSAELVRRAAELASRQEPASEQELVEVFSPDIVLDNSARVFNPHVYHGYEGLRAWYDDMREIWEAVSMTVTEVIQEGDRYLVLSDVRSRAGVSGIEFKGAAAGIWTAAKDGRLKHFLLLASENADRDEALAALRAEAGTADARSG